MRLQIEWTGKSYTDQIDNLSAAYRAAESVFDIDIDGQTVYKLHQLDTAEGRTDTAACEIWNKAEAAFANVAFSEWAEWPENWLLTA